MEYEQQHVIPRGYTSAWAAPNAPPGNLGKVWVIQKADTTDRELKSPKKYFWESERYTIMEGGERQLNVEKALQMTETEFGKVFNIALKTNAPITPEHRVALAFFIAATKTRTNYFPDLVRPLLRRVQEQASRLAAKDNRESALVQEIEDNLPKLNAESVSVGMTGMADILIQMKLTIFTTDDDAGFVTGDQPCYVWSPPGWHPGLSNRATELSMPLSPHHLAVYTWDKQCPMYSKMTTENVNRANARTISNCRKEFVSWKAIVRDEWFQPDAVKGAA